MAKSKTFSIEWDINESERFKELIKNIKNVRNIYLNA